MHPDHCADLIALANWALNTDDAPKIRVLGPPGWDARLNGFISEDGSRDLVRDVFHIEHLADGSVSSVGEFELTSRFVHHSVPTYGVRVTDKDSVLAYSGDSGPCQALEQLASDADVFLCEAGSREPVEHHMTVQQTYELAQSARVGRLLVTHTPDPAPSDETPEDGGRFVEFVNAGDEWVVSPRRA
jgi:ribonuclease BN (tRNA processing enzyme)